MYTVHSQFSDWGGNKHIIKSAQILIKKMEIIKLPLIIFAIISHKPASQLQLQQKRKIILFGTETNLFFKF